MTQKRINPLFDNFETAYEKLDTPEPATLTAVNVGFPKEWGIKALADLNNRIVIPVFDNK